MRISEARSAYYEHSGRASEVLRQSAYAGIAIVWIFNKSTVSNSEIALPTELVLVAALMLATLLADLMQYVLAALVWGWFSRHYERKFIDVEDPSVDAPGFLNWPSLALFWTKIFTGITGHIMLLGFLGTQVGWSA